MRKISPEELASILKASLLHTKTRYTENPEGKIADLRGTDLRGTDLSEANLSEADLRGANLSEANLSEANLIEANLSEANLRLANLRSVNLRRANLRGTDLSEADLRGAIGNAKEVKSGQIELYSFTYWRDKLSIGCQIKTLNQWKEFDASNLNEREQETWRRLSPILFALIEASPAIADNGELI